VCNWSAGISCSTEVTALFDGGGEHVFLSAFFVVVVFVCLFFDIVFFICFFFLTTMIEIRPDARALVNLFGIFKCDERKNVLLFAYDVKDIIYALTSSYLSDDH
jgi:hypothetical protein